MKARPKTKITPVEAIEIGLKMVELKNLTFHNDFILRLYVLGYSSSEASRLMRLARRFHGVSNARLLEAVDTVSKLNELLTLEDEEIDTLKAGGEVQGITLEDIKTMTVKELRAAIRGVSALRRAESLSILEAKMLQRHRLCTRNVQDVTDKRGPTVAPVALVDDLFCNPAPPAPSAAPARNDAGFLERANVIGEDFARPANAVLDVNRKEVTRFETPKATGWHVGMMQFVTPMGTWRMAYQQVNQGTRYASVTYHPATARAGYRAIFEEHAS